MRNTRIATLALGLVVALAGAAAALHVTMSAGHSASTGHASLSGDSGVDASDTGLSVGAGLVGDHATLDGAASLTLPTLPEAPEVPEVPEVPTTLSVPMTPEVPEAPEVSGSGSADGAAGLATEHASADAAGGAGIGL